MQTKKLLTLLMIVGLVALVPQFIHGQYIGKPDGNVLNFFSTESRRINLETKNASVAPIELANETKIVPKKIPKIAPAANVIITAPGRESAVTKI